MPEPRPDFQEIHDRYRSRIYGYVRRLTGGSEAEDLTQEVFLRISRALPDFRGDSSLSTWIYRVATNAALDRMRSPAFRRETAADIETCGPDTAVFQPAGSVEHQVVRREMDACLQEFILRLPEGQRAVFVLAELEELPARDIAEILGLSLPTVKIRLHRARARLRADLCENCDPGWAEDNAFVPALWRPTGTHPRENR